MKQSQTIFTRITLRVRARELADRVVAEAFAAGATGLEEREESGAMRLLVYAPPGAAERVEAALDLPDAQLLSVEREEPVDWSQAWKRELGPIEISPSLRVRPSFTPAPLRSDQREVVIDPGQAFGTGAHESTRLALEWVASEAPRLGPRDRLLDVGTGSGVLALAALRLSPARAVALDLDPLAADTAHENAEANGLAERLVLFTGPLSALREGECFELVIANLLGRELRPLFSALAARLPAGGKLVVSGLLAAECEALWRRGREAGLHEVGERSRQDESGVTWTSLCMSRSPLP